MRGIHVHCQVYRPDVRTEEWTEKTPVNQIPNTFTLTFHLQSLLVSYNILIHILILKRISNVSHAVLSKSSDDMSVPTDYTLNET